MNEQQLADLFSEQIDRMLQGHQPVTPANAADLQPLLTLGQQFSQINIQPSATAQAAFQSQLSAWFGSINGGTATVWGLSKTLLLTLTAAVITIGATLGVVLLTSLPEDWFDSQQQIVPNAPESPNELPEIPAPDSREETTVPSMPAAVPTPNVTVSDGDTLSPSSSSTGDTLSPTNSSLGDTLPSKPDLEESLSSPTSEPSPTAEVVNDVGGDTSDDDSNGSVDDSTDNGASTGDHDKGHGNDVDGVDDDNPGNSSGLPGSDQGDNSGGGPDFGQFSSGDNNGGGKGGQGGGNGGGNGNGGNQGNKGGQGKGKGNK